MSEHLKREVSRLKQKIIDLATRVENALCRSVEAVERRDPYLAREVIDGDAAIDQGEVDMEEDCLKILALHQPVASDLRFIVAVMKINNDVERIADLAVNIAERAEHLASQEPIAAPFDFREMCAKTTAMVRGSIEALTKVDVGLARKVRASDDEVDAINRQIYATLSAAVRRNPDHIERLLSYLSVSRHLERMADYATNIAEDVIYMATGEIVRHRPAEKPPLGGTTQRLR